jgi:26S proteasome regulatory subunit T5
MRSDLQLIQFESEHQRRKIRDNQEKIQINTQPPLLVSTVAEILPPEDHDEGMVDRDEAEDGQAMDVSANRTRTSAVIKTSTRQTIYLPHPGLVPTNTLRPGDLVGVNKDTYLIFEKLPDEFDQRVKAFEMEEKPTESYSDIAGCDEQIQELIEAVVLPMTHKDMFQTIGIKPPKGVLLHGPPGMYKCGENSMMVYNQSLVSNNTTIIHAPRNWKDFTGTSLCQFYQRYLLSASRTDSCANVHWRWLENGPTSV